MNAEIPAGASPKPSGRTLFVLGLAAAVFATALSWSGVSLRDLLGSLFR